MRTIITERAVRLAETKAKAIDLLGSECVHCGNEGTSGKIIDRLEFDHINNDREDDKHKLSLMWNCSWDEIVAELEKCQLLCRSCHSKKSMRERGFKDVSGHGKVSMYSHGCRCRECKDANNEYKKNWSRTRRRIA
jgi:hypothetical protein